MPKIPKKSPEALRGFAVAGELDELAAGLAANPTLARSLVGEPGESLLIHAIRSRQADCALALAPLSNATRRAKHGELPLILASKMGLAECVAALIPLSSPVAAKDGFDALAAACSEGHHGAVKVILAAQPHWALAIDRQGQTPLLLALALRQEACSNLLLPHSDCSVLAHGAESVLFRAARAGFGGIVRKVLSLSAARKLTAFGWTPLMGAAFNQTSNEDAVLDCVDALLPLSDTKRRVSKRDHWSYGLCAKDLAVSRGLLRVASRIEAFEAAQKEREELALLPLPSEAPLRRGPRI